MITDHDTMTVNNYSKYRRQSLIREPMETDGEDDDEYVIFSRKPKRKHKDLDHFNDNILERNVFEPNTKFLAKDPNPNDALLTREQKKEIKLIAEKEESNRKVRQEKQRLKRWNTVQNLRNIQKRGLSASQEKIQRLGESSVSQISHHTTPPPPPPCVLKTMTTMEDMSDHIREEASCFHLYRSTVNRLKKRSVELDPSENFSITVIIQQTESESVKLKKRISSWVKALKKHLYRILTTLLMSIMTILTSSVTAYFF